MIVAVESNFVLELTFRHDEAGECERILTLAANRAIQLAIPGCSLFEPYETLIRRRKKQEDIARKLEDELQEFARTEVYADLERVRTSSWKRMVSG